MRNIKHLSSFKKLKELDLNKEEEKIEENISTFEHELINDFKYNDNIKESPSINDIFKYLKENKYECLLNSQMENILIFAKVFKNNIHFFRIEKKSIHQQRAYKKTDLQLDFKHFNFEIKNLDKIYLDDEFLIFQYNEFQKSIKFRTHSYYSTIEHLTEKEKLILKDDIEDFKLKIQFLIFNFIKKSNSINNLNSL